MANNKVVWSGSKPERCDICNAPITNSFVDGKTTFGPWAMMCPPCHKSKGVGLGTGKGQKYDRDTDGKFVKAE